MRIKAKEKSGIVTVKAATKHSMLSYTEAKQQKKEVNFMTHIDAKVNGEIVYEASVSQFVSKNPYFKFKFNGSKGDEVVITWIDLKGKTKTGNSKIK